MNHSLQQKSRSIHLYLLGALIAVELLMSFSFLGYFHMEPISVTIAYIPVLLAGALMGPMESTILGTVFGLASMWKASASYTMAFDQLFSPAMSGYPVKSFLLSVGSRALFGFLVGLLYCFARKAKRPGPWIGVVSFWGPAIHSTLVYSALWVFFPQTGYTPFSSLKGLQTLNGIAGDAVTAALVLLLWYAAQSQSWNQFLARVETVQRLHLGEHYHTFSLVCMILLALVSSVAVAIYFVNRMESVLDQQGIFLSETEHADLLHLQTQFLIGILAMMALVIIFLIFNRRYTTYMDWESRRDAVTGAMNRKTFFQLCGKMLKEIEEKEGASSYFVMADIDHFKKINDHCGHPEGDRILREVVLELQAVFGRDNLIGRIGGDEFALLLCTPATREELERNLQRFLERLHNIRWGEYQVSCSIGALPAAPFQAVEELYQRADRLLYLAKENGKDQYMIGSLKSGVSV